MKFRLLLFLAAIPFPLITPLAQAEVVFENSSGISTNFYASRFEYGDDLYLAGTNRLVTDFLFEFYRDFSSSDDETARIRFYVNDGSPYGRYQVPRPQTVLYDSGTFSIASGTNGIRTVHLPGLEVKVPDIFTWSIEFGGLTGNPGDQAGALLRNPIQIGKSFRDFWVKEASGWSLFQFPNFNPPANFGVRVEAADAFSFLSIRRDTTGFVISWDGFGLLQSAPAINGPYTDLPKARSPYRPPLGTAPQIFWRVRQNPAPAIRFRRSGKELLLGWEGPGILQIATSPNGPYRDVTTATTGHSVKLEEAPQLFWRIRGNSR